MVVRVERTPEALGKGNGSELRVANRSRCTRACVTERRPEHPEEAPLATSGVWCRKGRIRLGTDGTHCRTGRCGTTWSVRCATTSAMRRALQEGHTPLPLQENARRRPWPQSPQRTRAKPWARTLRAGTVARN